MSGGFAAVYAPWAGPFEYVADMTSRELTPGQIQDSPKGLRLTW